MIISHSQLQEVLRAYGGFVVKTKRTDAQGRGQSTGIGEGLQEDRLTLSDQAREIQLVKEMALRGPDVRTDRVQAAGEKIASGAYNVTSEEVAEKLIARLLVDELL